MPVVPPETPATESDVLTHQTSSDTDHEECNYEDAFEELDKQFLLLYTRFLCAARHDITPPTISPSTIVGYDTPEYFGWDQAKWIREEDPDLIASGPVQGELIPDQCIQQHSILLSTAGLLKCNQQMLEMLTEKTKALEKKVRSMSAEERASLDYQELWDLWWK